MGHTSAVAIATKLSLLSHEFFTQSAKQFITQSDNLHNQPVTSMNESARSIWFLDGLEGRIPKEFKVIITQAVHSIWFQEQQKVRKTGAWCIGINSKKLLREVATAATPLGFSYVPWEKLGPGGPPIPESVADGRVICLFVWHPYDTLLCRIHFPRDQNLLFPTQNDFAKAQLTQGLGSLTFPEGAIANLPPQTCATCGAKAKNRCSACRISYYCNVACQKKDAARHGKACDVAATKKGLSDLLSIKNRET